MIQKDYDILPNHRKTVRLFEIYRTLQENNLCDIIDRTTITSIVDMPSNMTPQELVSEPIIIEEDVVVNRTIGDGNSRRDQELNDIFNEIENGSPLVPDTSGENAPTTQSQPTTTPSLINELNE
jgi:hypothetical protein